MNIIVNICLGETWTWNLLRQITMDHINNSTLAVLQDNRVNFNEKRSTKVLLNRLLLNEVPLKRDQLLETGKLSQNKW